MDGGPFDGATSAAIAVASASGGRGGSTQGANGRGSATVWQMEV